MNKYNKQVLENTKLKTQLKQLFKLVNQIKMKWMLKMLKI